MLPAQPRSKKGKVKMKLAPKERTKASTTTRATTPPLEFVPEVDETTVAVPEVAVPEVAVPEVAVPEVAVPEVAVPEVAVPEMAVPETVEAESALTVAVPAQEPVVPKPKKALKALPASHPSDKGNRKLADYCTSFRGRSQTPASGSGAAAAAAAAAASKKRPRMSAADAAKARQAKHAAARPGLEIVNGQMVIRALEIGGVDSDEDDDREEVDEESGVTSTYSSFTDRTRTERWGIEETRRFYRALQQCGTDFSLMLTQFPGRTQKQLKNKFRKETKERPELVDMALDPKVARALNVDPYASSFGPGVVIGDSSTSSSSSSSSSSGSVGGAAVSGESEVGTRRTSAFSQMQESEADLVSV